MENDKLLFRASKKQSLEDWVNEFNGTVYGYTYTLLIELTVKLSSIHSEME